MKQSSTCALTCKLLLAVAILLGAPLRADAGMITVVGDVSAQNNFSFFDAVLGPQTSVVFSRGALHQPTLRSHWDGLPGVSAIESSAALTTSFLSSVDLLVVTNFSEPLDYTAAEIGAVAQHVENGGALLMIVEFNTLWWDPNLYNPFLEGVGSEIRFNDVRTNTLESIPPQDTPLTAGLENFNTSAYNTLSGGIPAYIGVAGTAVAYEGYVVPEPGTGLLCLLGLAVAWRFGRSRAGFVVLVLTVLVPATSRAALITVTDLVDDADTANGTCTLREAIRSANDNVSVDACAAGSALIADAINVQPGTHLVDLASGNDEDNAVTGDLDILEDVSIRGSSAEFSIIDGSLGPTDRLLQVHENAGEVIFEKLALRGGNADDASKLGGVLWNVESSASQVQLLEVELSGGTARVGGGIVNQTRLGIFRSRITGNQTTVDLGATGNIGGGIASTGVNALLYIAESEISGNQAEEDGAGLWIGVGGSFDLYRSRVTGNVGGGDGGGLYVGDGNYEVDYVEFSNNTSARGGGVYMLGPGEIQHSAFFGNEATSSGGGIHDDAGGFVRFTTLSNNTAPTGAGIYANAAMQTLLDAATIAGNNGHGVFNQSGAFFENTLIAQNSGGNCAGSAPAFGAFNLEDTDTCGFVSGVDMPNFPNTNPMIGPLQDNGGPTPTMALLPGSPAIDVVTSEIRTTCHQMLDQRGYPRGRPRADIGGNDVYLCDLGAYEVTTPFVVEDLADAVDDDLADDLCQTLAQTCTLRAAIQQANVIPGMNEIELGAGSHLLSIAGTDEDNAATGDLDLDTPVWIRGAGTGSTTVHGNGLDRVFDVGSPDHTATNAPELTRIEDLTIRGGDAGLDSGGGIATTRDLRAERLFLFGNHARRGSAISSVRTGSFSGGEPFPVEIVDSIVTFNSGALPLYLADAHITGSSVVDNTATIATNGGAGEFINLTLKNSTISRNFADSTGALFAGSAIIDSSTIYDNSSDFAPGGVFLLGLSVFRNSIMAGNLAGGLPEECAFNPGAITSFGYNVTSTSSNDCNLAHGTDQTETDPMLEALAYNGGPTLTHLPAVGSPAIDAGDPFDCPPLDQRGVVRPQDGDDNGSFICDVGAVEVVPEPSSIAGLLAGGLALAGLAKRRARG